MIYEVATSPGDLRRPNEDYAGVLGDCALLIDGTGAPGNMPTGCIHGVLWFVQQLGRRLLSAMAAPAALSLPSVLSQTIEQVAALHSGTCDLSAPGTPSALLVMTRITGTAMEYLLLGDCTLTVQMTRPGVRFTPGHLSTPVELTGTVESVTDSRMGLVAAEEYEAMLRVPIGSPDKQAARMRYVHRQRPYRNAPGGYPVVSTDPDAAFQAYTGAIPFAMLRRCVLTTDGASRYVEYGLSSWEKMLKDLSSHGPKPVLGRLRERENEDPDGIRWPRAKRHDDASLIFAEVSP